MNITTEIKHKHAGHLIIIEDTAFKANDAGKWDLTEIWQALNLDKKKQPGQWRTLEAQRLERMQFLHSLNNGRAGSKVMATKRATIEYAGWVSDEFKDMVFDAFEAILEMPEVALLVAEKMRSLGHDHSAANLERSAFNDKCDWNSKAFGRRAPKVLTAQQEEMQKYHRQATYAANKAHKSGDWKQFC